MTPDRGARLPLGKLLISSTAVAGMIGPYLFDWNETHIFNAAWPPHAKFHNAQTMSSGVVLGLATLFHLWRPGSSRESLDSAAITASTYYVSQLSAWLYPGTASADPPREELGPAEVHPAHPGRRRARLRHRTARVATSLITRVDLEKGSPCRPRAASSTTATAAPTFSCSRSSSPRPCTEERCSCASAPPR